MKTCRLAFWILATLASLLLSPSARAAITCSTFYSPGVSINYVTNTTVTMQTFFSVTCSRDFTTDPTSITYSVTTTNNGTNPNGINNRATSTSNAAATVNYDFYTASGCGTQWKGKTAISDTITWGTTGTGPITRQTTFWACITTAQAPTTSGLYSDTVGLALSAGTQTLPATAQVSIYAPALCTITTPPGNISLTYKAFGPAVSNSTQFWVQCTVKMPYTMATDVTQNVLNGVRYSLALSSTASNGTGAPQNFSITASANGGQAGTCAGGACPPATRTHTLTISY